METTKGITSTKAQNLLGEFGYNEIIGKPRQTTLQILLSQFTSFLVWLLIAAAVGSIVLGDLVDGAFILLIVVINGIFGFIQEFKAEKTISVLKQMTTTSVRVFRDGVEQKIDSKLIVPGDLVILEEGDKVPADGQVVHGIHLEVNEASLTGESLPVEKSSSSGSDNKVYLGTIVVKGRANVLVTKTGMNTRFGNIASSLSKIKEEETALQKKLRILGKQLGGLAILSSAIVFVIGYLSKHQWIDILLTSVSLAVAAIPEGLPAVITVTLAVGMQNMARQKAILRKLSSIESLGSATVIATDKTGTLTRNQMRVSKVWFGNNAYNSNDRGLKNINQDFYKLLTAGVYCNNASLIFKHATKSYDVLGDTTEGSLMIYAAERGLLIDKIKKEGKLAEEYAFDPLLKTMTVVWQNKNTFSVFTKGAPETVLSNSKYMLSNGSLKRLNQKIKNDIEDAFKSFAKDGLRVIALAYKNHKKLPLNRINTEKDLIFIGFVGIVDPPRPEVANAIQVADKAGIRTIMITGDNELTAEAIGIKIGLIKPGEEIVTGKQFDKMSDKEVVSRLDNIRIFARTTPDQKLRIVGLLQSIGHIVAVTGDGVNDALALKQADVGVAMGITGTDVAKEAADMIITDDNYATLVTAVEEGRTIFDNIKSCVKFLVGCNLGEVLAVIIGMLLGWPLILTPIQLLYINLVTDGLPAIALAVTPKDGDVMSRNPRRGNGMFRRIDNMWLLEVSVLTAAITLFAFWMGLKTGDVEVARTFSFTAIIFVQVLILLDVRSKDSSFIAKNVFKDKVYLIAFMLPLVLQPLIIYVPYISKIFKVTEISMSNIITVVGVSMVILISSEFRKQFILRTNLFKKL